MFRDFLLAAALVCASLPAAWADQPAPKNALAEYIARPDANFGWREVATGNLAGAEFAEYLLTSQTWRGVAWKHQLFVLRPTKIRDPKHALLFIHGGRWKAEYEGDRKDVDPPAEAMLFVRLAETIGAPVAILRQVPFQPMFDRREDALIAYTFEQYLRTGESDWPLLLPMTKSAVRAMDALQSIVKTKWGASVESFTVAGASKRGWTTWLTAATDKRVMAAAPMVIDVLNMQVQMEHQRATWGEFSDEIRDYSQLDLQSQLKTPRGQQLMSIVDPYSYRKQLTLPKLILLSTNDRYWPLDALKFYYPELPGPKHVLYVPNQGHGLNDPERVLTGLTAIHRYAAMGKTLPTATWSFGTTADKLTIQVKPDRLVQRVLVWSAQRPTRDFRDAYWSSQECAKTDDGYTCAADRAKNVYSAAFAETSYKDEGAPAFSTTTTVCITAPNAADTKGC
ncbi:MAG: PhoPQ-activated protein PqaA family protein [Steroidobacter sp.]